jgi:hypothetical protein
MTWTTTPLLNWTKSKTLLGMPCLLTLKPSPPLLQLKKPDIALEVDAEETGDIELLEDVKPALSIDDADEELPDLDLEKKSSIQGQKRENEEDVQLEEEPESKRVKLDPTRESTLLGMKTALDACSVASSPVKDIKPDMATLEEPSKVEA